MSQAAWVTPESLWWRPRRAFANVSATRGIVIDESCTACGACLATCPTHALLAAPKRPRVVDERCTDCWDCIEICPAGAINATERISD